MKSARIILLVATVVVFSIMPVVVYHGSPQCRNQIDHAVSHVATSITRPVAVQAATVGQSFPIAGQEEVQETGIVLRAPDDCEVGELVRLDASESDADGLTWQILPSTPDFEIIEDGRRAFFSARSESAGQSFLIIVAGAKAGKPFLTHHTIDVIGIPPNPGPEMLSAVVRKWVRGVPEYEGRKAHALALSGVFRKLATADDITVDQILEATATANSAVLGNDLERWLPFLGPLGEELDRLTSLGKLLTRDDYKAVWIAIADGIEKGI